MRNIEKGIRVSSDRELRVFLSYSHQDVKLVRRLAALLKHELGVVPFYDQSFQVGRGFDEQIKMSIAHAHVFMPVLTPASDSRKWVHEEIGYASALNIPVLPLAIGKLPGEMLQRLHAEFADPRNIKALHKTLTLDRLQALIREKGAPRYALYQCASYPDERAAWLSSFATDVISQEALGLLRQKGALSSLHIPREVPTHPIWEKRYAPHMRAPEHIRLQREERIALEQHARGAGCRLIINPAMEFPDLAPSAVVVRLQSLLAFLESMPAKKCEVACNDSMVHNESVTIVGNWFAAESVRARRGAGYFQTIFTRHAPTIMAKIDEFDEEFDGLLQIRGCDRKSSCRMAIGHIRRRIAILRRNSKA